MENKTDVIVIGAGPAGVSAAMTLAKAGKEVLLVDRSDKAGDKNMFGGAIYAKQTAEIFPDFWESAPIEKSVIAQKIFMLTEKDSTTFEYRCTLNNDHKAFSVIRSKWDSWCVEQVKNAGGYFAPKTLVKELLIENGKVVGIQTEFEKFYANIVIIADGVNSLLAKQIGLRNDIKDSDVTLNVKEVFKLPKQRLNDRFNLNENEGCACKIIGGPLKEMMALGFMYTNQDSISLGYGVGLDELKKLKKTPYELLDELKSHPTIAKYIKDGEVIEYSAHLIPEGGLSAMPKLYDNRVMVVGDAAMFVNNIHMEGTNLAMLSGKLAGETAILALDNCDYSAATLSLYYEKLKNSVVIQDLSTHKNTIPFIKKHINTITKLYPELLCEFFDLFTNADGISKRKKYRDFLFKIIKNGVILKSIPLGFFALEKCFKK